MRFKQLIFNTLCLLLCFLYTLPAFAQKDTGIKGVVTDELGDPLPAASIAVMNNKKIARGANTNLYGEFTIDWAQTHSLTALSVNKRQTLAT